MTINDLPEIETSPLSGQLTHGGVTVDVQIYRFADSNERWVLQVIDEQNSSKVWDDTFASDRAAYAEFYRTRETEDDGSFVEPPRLSTYHPKSSPIEELLRRREIARLKKLRAWVVTSRRSGTAKSEHDNVEHVIICQKAIRAIDDAIADEKAMLDDGMEGFFKGSGLARAP
jgi:hypothetical protein